MKRNIEDYLMVFNNAISDDICDETIKEIEASAWKQHTYYDPTLNEFIPENGDREFDISYSNGELTDILMSSIYGCLSNYMQSLNFSWFNGWSGYTSIRFNRYKENTLMNEHCDHIHSIFDGQRKGIPVISILGILNEDYVGGELIFWEDQKIDVKKGDILLWPSNFLYPHKVNPVTEGTRYSFVSWAW